MMVAVTLGRVRPLDTIKWLSVAMAATGALLGGVLIGVTEAVAGLLFTPSLKSMFAFAILVLVLLFRPQGLLGKRLA